MVKHTQTIRRQFADELFEWVDHLVRLALKGLKDRKNVSLLVENRPYYTMVYLQYSKSFIFVQI